MLEGITILDVVNTGALGMMFLLVMKFFDEMKETRKDNNAMWRELVGRVTFIEKAQGITPQAHREHDSTDGNER